MTNKSNEYGYVPSSPTQAFNSNTGVFEVNDVLDLLIDDKWTNFGQLEIIETLNLSGVSSATFTDIKQDKYDVHFLTTSGFIPSTNNIELRCRFYESGVEESGSVYWYAYQYNESALAESKSAGTIDYLRLTYSTSNTIEGGHGYSYFYNLGDVDKYSHYTMHTMTHNSFLNPLAAHGSGGLRQKSVVDNIKIYTNSGTFNATVSLYGLRFS